MSKSNIHETNYLKLLFQNVNFANVGDATGLRGSTTAGSLYIALFTAVTDGEAGTVTEVTSGLYTNYARVAVARTTGGWAVSGNTASNVGEILFPTSSGGTGATVTHFGIYTASVAGTLLGFGALTSSITVNSGDTPKFNAGDLTIVED